MEEYGTGDSQSFRVFPHESVADEDEESVPGQTTYADFDFAVCFLIGGRLTLDYDENMALLMEFSITITLGFKTSLCVDASIV